jgi:hypothetical protein
VAGGESRGSGFGIEIYHHSVLALLEDIAGINKTAEGCLATSALRLE